MISCRNVFEFKPGSRWGVSKNPDTSSANINGEETEF